MLFYFIFFFLRAHIEPLVCNFEANPICQAFAPSTLSKRLTPQYFVAEATPCACCEQACGLLQPRPRSTIWTNTVMAWFLPCSNMWSASAHARRMTSAFTPAVDQAHCCLTSALVVFRAQGATVRAHDSAQNQIDPSGAQLDGVSPPQRVKLVHQCVVFFLFFLTARQMQLKSGRKLEELGVTHIGVCSTIFSFSFQPSAFVFLSN